jgi:hypothetical protein
MRVVRAVSLDEKGLTERSGIEGEVRGIDG